MRKVLVFVLMLTLILTYCFAYAADSGTLLSLVKAPGTTAALYEPTEKSAVIVEDLVNLKERYTDSLGNYAEYSYRLPKVTGPESEYIRFVNNDINRLYDLYIESQLQSIAEGYSLFVYKVDYSVSNFNGITSIVVTIEADADCTYYSVYNFKYDGTQAYNKDVFTAAGISSDAFVINAKNAVQQYLSGYTLMQDLYNRTLSDENINVNIPVLITDSGKVVFEAAIYTPAGAGRYSHLFMVG